MAGLGIEAGVLNLLIGAKLAAGFAEDLADQLGKAIRPATEEASRTLSDKLAAGFESAGKKASVAITAPLTALATKGVFDAQKVASGLAEVVSLSGRTGEEAAAQIAVLRDEVALLSADLGVAQSTLVGGLYQAISAGVPEDNVFEFLKVAGQAAIAGVTDTETAVDGLTTVINAFGLDADDAQAVADSLFTAVKGGKTTFEELAGALFNVAPAAAAAGVDFQTVNAAIATLTAAGVPTSVATTQIRAAIVALQRPSEELDEIFSALGFTTRAAAIEQLGLQGALGAVTDAAEGDNGQLQKLLGSVEAVGAAQIITSTGAEKFAAELEAQANAAGATQAAFELIDETRGFDRLKVQLENLSVSIGTILLPIVTQAAEFFADLAGRFQNLSPETQKLIVVIGGIAAAIGPVLIITAKLITSIKTIIAVVKGLSLALAANPWVLVAAAAIAAVVLIIKYWDEIVEFFAIIWDGIKAAASVLWDALTVGFEAVAGVVTGIWDGIVSIATGAFDAIKAVLAPFQGAFEATFNLISEIAKLAFEVIGLAVDLWLLPFRIGFEAAKAIAVPFFEGLKAVASAAFGILRTVAAPVFAFYKAQFQIIKRIAEILWKGLSTGAQAAWGIVKNVTGAAVGLIKRLVEPLGKVFSAVWDTLKNAAQTAVDFVLGIIQKVRDAITGIRDSIKDLPGNIVGGVGGFLGDVGGAVGGFLGFADGGRPPVNTPVLVGERGPEIFVPRTAGTVIPNEQLGNLGGGDVYTINVYNPREETTSTSIPNALRQAQYLRG